MRSVLAVVAVVAVVAVTMLTAAAAGAEDRANNDPVAPTPAVAAAWKQEAPKPSPALRTLFVSYAATQGLDVASTRMARARGAIETNLLLQGDTAAGLATKAALGAVTVATVRSIDRHSRKAAILTMIAANAATAAVAVHNYRVAAHLRSTCMPRSMKRCWFSGSLYLESRRSSCAPSSASQMS